ncbi:uncharacterized protein I303_105297 [Kwoniella dejecticola CBS 10117]|uniref:Calpain catalytic domain-containing protein n=1 Tax=Kwoniella dejecticola CBS 10117 TaxID=1296121 RepID=A0A1A6A2V8_9TREE|nr:uncharacterized protein I303_05255 [Kwoniella dejecticola CBS 10117]OBR84397.1 hypothetical protein I303_05255 [Kwoniella dejecticola CBS 10117]
MLLNTAVILLASSSALAIPTEFTENQDLKRELGGISLWRGKVGPKVDDVMQHDMGMDWLYCVASWLAESEQHQKKLIDRLPGVSLEQGGQTISDTNVELWNIKENTWKTYEGRKYSEVMVGSNGNGSMAYDDLWWPGALGDVARVIADEEGYAPEDYIIPTGINADVGMKMLLGEDGASKKLEGDDDQIRDELHQVLDGANTSPVCPWRNNLWITVLSTEEGTNIETYHSDKHEYKIESFDDVYQHTTWYAKLEESL